MNRLMIAAMLGLFSLSSYAEQRLRPDIDVNVPPEVFSSGGQRAQPCNMCCIYQDQNYSEGAVVRADGVLLQCQRDERTISTNPLVWRRMKE
ncbi:YnjH family protein [Enterobacteriaceae bacterium RIT814]|nr:YnjH family protein [Enterobacteriaceae bacterium RIT 814]